jgi:hypothetical protein
VTALYNVMCDTVLSHASLLPMNHDWPIDISIPLCVRHYCPQTSSGVLLPELMHMVLVPLPSFDNFIYAGPNNCTSTATRHAERSGMKNLTNRFFFLLLCSPGPDFSPTQDFPCGRHCDMWQICKFSISVS